MRILACLLLCVYAVSADSGYADVQYGGYLDLKNPSKECHYVGQYLKHPKDECKFLRCDYGNEPWKDQYGKIQLFAREMRCANGLSVGYGYSKGYDNPCDTPNKKCFVYPKKQHDYHEVDTKAVYDSYDDSHNGYGKEPEYGVHNTHHNTHNSYDQGYDKHSQKHNSYDTHKSDYNTHNTHNSGYDTHNTHKSDYNTHNSGYDTHKSGYDTHKSDYDTHKSDYNPHKSGYDTHKSGYDTHKNTYDNKKTTYEQHVYNVHDTKHSGYDNHPQKKDY